MTADEAKKGEPPEFGLNGSVLNAPGISEEVRQAYLNGNTLISFSIPRNITLTGVLSCLSWVFWTAAIFAFGYTMGMEHPRPFSFSSNDWYNIIPFALLLSGAFIDLVNDRLKKREER